MDRRICSVRGQCLGARLTSVCESSRRGRQGDRADAAREKATTVQEVGGHTGAGVGWDAAQRRLGHNTCGAGERRSTGGHAPRALMRQGRAQPRPEATRSLYYCCSSGGPQPLPCLCGRATAAGCWHMEPEAPGAAAKGPACRRVLLVALVASPTAAPGSRGRAALA